jgi:serine/threonine-protein kinase
MWNVRLARRQVRAFGQFSHAAVVPFVDVGTAGGTHYLVWPLVQGDTLENVVQSQGPLTPAKTAQVGVQIASGLVACHAQTLFHGLLKPSNVMVGPDFQVAILDFGIGSLLAENEGESLVDTMSTANTLTSGLDCASPESIMEPTNRTPAGDQYSLGCILYFCLTGRYPFADGSAVEKMMAHQFKAPAAIKDSVPTAPDALVDVIERLMQKKPEDRFGGADEVADRLLPLTDGRPVQGAYADQGPAAPAVPQPRPGSFAPAPKPTRPSSFILPPPHGPSAVSPAGSAAAALFPTPLPNPPRGGSGGYAALPVADAPVAARADSRGDEMPSDRSFSMPPGYVPERSRGPQFGPLAVAAVGIGAMILSYITFLSFNPFK